MPNLSGFVPSPKSLDSLIERLGGIDTASPMTHGGVRFDPRDGLGAVPDGANLDYSGFLSYMKPDEFLSLNPGRDPSVSSIDHIKRHIDAGEPLGTPMLWVDRTPSAGGTDVPIDAWEVRGHEGRGRMMALRDMNPDSLYPVGVKPYGWVRARHLTPRDPFVSFMPDEQVAKYPPSGVKAMPSIPSAAVLNGKPLFRPGYEDTDAIRALIQEILLQQE